LTSTFLQRRRGGRQTCSSSASTPPRLALLPSPSLAFTFSQPCGLVQLCVCPPPHSPSLSPPSSRALSHSCSPLPCGAMCIVCVYVCVYVCVRTGAPHWESRASTRGHGGFPRKVSSSLSAPGKHQTHSPLSRGDSVPYVCGNACKHSLALVSPLRVVAQERPFKPFYPFYIIPLWYVSGRDKQAPSTQGVQPMRTVPDCLYKRIACVRECTHGQAGARRVGKAGARRVRVLMYMHAHRCLAYTRAHSLSAVAARACKHARMVGV